MLSDQGIRAELDKGSIGILPLIPENVQPASVDLRLDYKFEVVRQSPWQHLIDPSVDNQYSFSTQESRSCFDISPGDFVLGSTYETVFLSDKFAAKVEGKSSLGRLGLLVHATAGFIDPGFEGQITLELANLTPHVIRLYPGMLIAQICFFRLEQPAESVYGAVGRGSHYSGQRGPTLSRSWQNFSVSDLD